MSASERPLHEADRGAAQRPPGNPVADPGDLPLVGDQPGERGPGALGDLGSHAPRPGGVSWIGERFGPIRPTRPPSGHHEISISRQTRTCEGPPPIAPSIRSRWGWSSTISTGARAGSSAVSRAISAIAARSTRGVGDHDVLEPLGGEMQGLGGGERVYTSLKPGSSSRIRRRTGTERTDFEATRIGSPPACATIAALLRRIASSRRSERWRDGGEDRVVTRLEVLEIDGGAGSRRGERI